MTVFLYKKLPFHICAFFRECNVSLETHPTVYHSLQARRPLLARLTKKEGTPPLCSTRCERCKVWRTDLARHVLSGVRMVLFPNLQSLDTAEANGQLKLDGFFWTMVFKPLIVQKFLGEIRQALG